MGPVNFRRRGLKPLTGHWALATIHYPVSRAMRGPKVSSSRA